MRWLVVVAFLGLAHPVAWASSLPDDKARDWYESGKEFYQEGKYSEALVAFETAYRLSRRSTLLRSIGYCYEKLGRLNEALEAYYLWRAEAEMDKLPEIERHIRRIEAALQMAPTAPAPAVSPQVVQPAPTPEPEPEPEPEPREPWRISTGPTVGYGFAGAAVVTGAVFSVQAGHARTEAEANCSLGDAVFCRDSASSAIYRDGLFSLLADVSFGVAGVGAVGATLWMLLDNQQTSVQFSPTLNGFAIRGQF